MTNRFFVAVFVMGASVFTSTANAYVDADKCRDSGTCATTITTDSGTAKVCKDTSGTFCMCGEGIGSCDYALATPPNGCPTGYHVAFATVAGHNCCKKCTFTAGELEQMDQSIESVNDDSLVPVFDNNMSESALLADVHFGFMGTTNRSPNTGRTVSAGARLDVCLAYADVDTITGLAGNDDDRYSLCAGSTYGCGTPSKNEYCQNNGSAVCVDRCACYYSGNTQDTCNSL